MDTKKCFKCQQIKPLNEFYKHPRMEDGHLNKCKDCNKKDTKTRQDFLKDTDPNWVENEKSRHRKKYHRLGYRTKHKPSRRAKRICMKKYNERYPEKRLAKNACQDIEIKKEHERHHWSYNQEHWRDVIEITISKHALAHRNMIYDQERMMYRTKGGILLDTRQKHIEYINSLVDND